jgi:hypothetical protein
MAWRLIRKTPVACPAWMTAYRLMEKPADA